LLISTISYSMHKDILKFLGIVQTKLTENEKTATAKIYVSGGSGYWLSLNTPKNQLSQDVLNDFDMKIDLNECFVGDVKEALINILTEQKEDIKNIYVNWRDNTLEPRKKYFVQMGNILLYDLGKKIDEKFTKDIIDKEISIRIRETQLPNPKFELISVDIGNLYNEFMQGLGPCGSDGSCYLVPGLFDFVICHNQVIDDMSKSTPYPVDGSKGTISYLNLYYTIYDITQIWSPSPDTFKMDSIKMMEPVYINMPDAYNELWKDLFKDLFWFTRIKKCDKDLERIFHSVRIIHKGPDKYDEIFGKMMTNLASLAGFRPDASETIELLKQKDKELKKDYSSMVYNR